MNSFQTSASSLATIHVGKNLKCPVKTVLLHGDLNEALASEMMPPPPPPPPLYHHYPSSAPSVSTYPSLTPQVSTQMSTAVVPSFKNVINVANNILLPPHHETGGEVEFYKNEMDTIVTKSGSLSSSSFESSQSLSSGGSANHDDFEDEDGPINGNLGRATFFNQNELAGAW